VGTYGRNFDFLVTPLPMQRRGRFQLVNGADIPIGVPVKVAAAAVADAQFSALPASLATTATTPVQGRMGIALYEWIDLNQLDPQYSTYSDRDTVPDERLFQLISGSGIKVKFRNTTDRTFLQTRAYDGRVMVAGVGATPTVAVGDYLTPGVGNDSSGYWAETADATKAWLIVTSVNATTSEVEAEMLF
jgi:hypothetical protein